MYRALVGGAISVKVPFARECELAQQYGFRGIGVSMGPIGELGIDGVQQLLDTHDLVAGLAGMPVNFREDDAAFEEGLAELPRFAQAMTELGCTRAATWIKPWHETLTYEQNFQQLRERTSRICNILEPYGLRYGLEFVGPETVRRGKPNPFIYDIDGMMELIEAVDVPNLGLLLDSFHWYTSGGAAEDLAKLSDELIVVVHVNDAATSVSRKEQIDGIRAMPAETGVIDMETFMGALAKMDYTGPVMVEPFSNRVRAMSAEEAVRATAESLDAIWPS